MSLSARRWRRIHVTPPTGPTAYQQLVLSAGPVAYWTLAGGSAGFADLTGNGHTAVPRGSPGATTFPDGSAATVFDGLTQYAEVASATALQVPTTGIMTVEAWLRPDVTTFPAEESTGYVHWLGKGDATDGYEWVSRMYGLDNTEGRANRISGYEFNTSGGLGAGSYFQDAVTAGQWIYYVLVINSVNTSSAFPTGYTSIYKNGVLRQTRGLNSFSVVPGATNAPVRIATRDFASFFEGALANIALYGYELTPVQVRGHWQQVYPVPPGTAALLGTVGTAASTSSATATIAVTETIPAGSTILVQVVHDYTTGAPTCADSKGTVYTRDRTASSSPLNIRASQFSGQVNLALQPGDKIQVQASAVVDTLVITADAFSGVVFGGAGANVDQVNSTSGTSTTPGTTIPVTTTHADDLLHGFVAVQGPDTDGYTEDVIFPWDTLTREGTSGDSPDFTVNAAYDSVTSAGTYNYRPVLGVSRNWLEIITAYKGGNPTVVPPVAGTAQLIQSFAAAPATTAGITLTLTVPPGGIPVGHTIILKLLTLYSTATVSATDARGNTWTLDRTGSDTGHTQFAAQFHCAPATALQGGDLITVTTGNVATRIAAADEYASVLQPVVLDGQNSSGGSSTLPQLGTGITTAHADDLLTGAVFVTGPDTDDYAEDVFGQWTSLAQTGTSGAPGGDLALNSAYRAVGSTGTYNYKPELGTSRVWGEFVIAYEAT